jgi:stage IV sporulation protein FB
MAAEIPSVSQFSRLEPALKLLQGRSVPAVGVVDWDGRLVGYITSENIGELMLVETASRGRTPRRAAGPLLPQ